MKIFRISALWLVLGLGGLASCKKDNVEAAADVRDSVYYVAQELFLWSDQLPTMEQFKPTTYGTPEDVMTKVRTFSPKGTLYPNLDRWSGALPKKTADDLFGGVNTDYGMRLRYAATTDLRVANVYASSAAGTQGVKRGWKVVSINGITPNASSASVLNTELSKPSVSAVFELPNGDRKTLALTASQYQANTVISQQVIPVAGKNIGYLAFDSFTGNTVSQELENAFLFFKTNNVSDLVVDLRYNGGGYVSVAERFANLVAPASVRGKLMYRDTHNQRYANWNRTKNFDASAPANALNLSRIVFITTSRSASASELLINVLKPYMDVKLIGGTTYGKPAGYYLIPVMDYYSFPLAVKQVNANGYGDFYEGLPADKTQADDLTRDFGDTNEACLKDALAYLNTGRMPASVSTPQQARMESVRAVNQALDTDWKGMIFERPLPKK